MRTSPNLPRFQHHMQRVGGSVPAGLVPVRVPLAGGNSNNIAVRPCFMPAQNLSVASGQPQPLLLTTPRHRVDVLENRNHSCSICIILRKKMDESNEKIRRSFRDFLDKRSVSNLASSCKELSQIFYRGGEGE